MIDIECASCGHAGVAPESAIGKSVRCPKCKTAIKVADPSVFVPSLAPGQTRIQLNPRAFLWCMTAVSAVVIAWFFVGMPFRDAGFQSEYGAAVAATGKSDYGSKAYELKLEYNNREIGLRTMVNYCWVALSISLTGIACSREK